MGLGRGMLESYQRQGVFSSYGTENWRGTGGDLGPRRCGD